MGNRTYGIIALEVQTSHANVDMFLQKSLPIAEE